MSQTSPPTPLARLASASIVFTLAVAAVFMAVRIGALAHGQAVEPGMAAGVYAMGLRFDLKYIGTILAPLWALAMLVEVARPRWSGHVARFGSGALVGAFGLAWGLAFTDLGFIVYFHHPIDILFFELFADDTWAILVTIVRDVRLAGLLLGLLGGMAVYAPISRRLAGRLAPRLSGMWKGGRWAPVAAALVAAAGWGGFARGSVGMFPLGRSTAAVSKDPYLNSIAINGPFNLYYASKDRKASRFPQTAAEALTASKFKSIEQALAQAGYPSADALVQTSLADPSIRPPHVIFVLMEGWSSHIALLDRPGNDVLGEFRAHRDADHFFPYLYSNGNGTEHTIEELLVNAPLADVSQSVARRTPFRHATAEVFRRAGYRTAFYSGGSSTWQNHAEFLPRQGFDELHGREEVERRSGRTSVNPWGAPDGDLLDFVWDGLVAADTTGKPLFGFVLTTTNHDPVVLPDGYRPGPVDPAAYGYPAQDERRILQLQGYQYASSQLGRFLTRIQQSELRDRVVVVATGDHTRRNLGDAYEGEQDLFRILGVAAYFHVPDALDRLKEVPAETVGSHADLFPTIFDLAVPGARFLSLGHSFVRPTERRYGWIERDLYLFDAGVTPGGGKLLFPFTDRAAGIVAATGQPLETWQMKSVERTRAIWAIQRWLLARQYEDPRYDPVGAAR